MKNSPDDVMDTSDTKLIHRLTQREDLFLAEKALNLDPDEAKNILTLKNRECYYIVSGQMPSAELHRIPDIEFETYDINEVREMMAPHIAKLDYVPYEPPSKAVPVSEQKETAMSAALSAYINKNRKKIEMFLYALGGQPLKAVSVFSKNLPFDVDDQFLNNLANARYITYPVNLSFGKRGPSMQYVEMLPAGAKFIGKDLIDVTLPPGKNRTLQSKIAVYNIFLNRKKDGSKVALEWKGADVAEWAGKSLFLYEYETAVQPHIITNVTRDIENGCTMVYVVMDTKAQRDEAEALLKMSLLEKDFKKVGFKATQKFL